MLSIRVTLTDKKDKKHTFYDKEIYDHYMIAYEDQGGIGIATNNSTRSGTRLMRVNMAKTILSKVKGDDNPMLQELKDYVSDLKNDDSCPACSEKSDAAEMFESLLTDGERAYLSHDTDRADKIMEKAHDQTLEYFKRTALNGDVDTPESMIEILEYCKTLPQVEKAIVFKFITSLVSLSSKSKLKELFGRATPEFGKHITKNIDMILTDGVEMFFEARNKDKVVDLASKKSCEKPS